jgi:hypothetical protein
LIQCHPTEDDSPLAKLLPGPIGGRTTLRRERPLCTDIVDLVAALFRTPPFSGPWSIFWGVARIGPGIGSDSFAGTKEKRPQRAEAVGALKRKSRGDYRLALLNSKSGDCSCESMRGFVPRRPRAKDAGF